MSRLLTKVTPLAGLFLVSRSRVEDQRGYLSRVFCAEELAPFGWTQSVAQINHTKTKLRGTVRGLHYQRQPHSEAKLVSCLRGEVWDVAIDLRPVSPTYLQWHAQLLTSENGLALLIPPGFAHGFQALSDDVELLYCHSTPYTPAAEAGINPQDPLLAINWPLPVICMSARDKSHPFIQFDFEGVSL